MRGKLFLTILLAAAAVAALGGILVAVAGADDTATLPDITAPELIARMGDHSRAPDAISGDITWTNELFGELPFMPDHVAQPAESPLMASGSGRLWAQDGKLRLESQGQGGDQVLVADAEAGTVWTYTFVDDTARLYEWAGDGQQAEGSSEGETPEAAPTAHGEMTPERVSSFLQAAARFMSVEVGGQTFVAGRDAYVLTMTPAAPDTALGKVEAAIDGETFVPLRLDVVAKGAETPTLSFGFTRISYEPVDDDVFAFTPPDGAKVERETIDPQGGGNGDGAVAPGAGAEGDAEPPSAAERDDMMAQMKELARTALLSREEASGLVDFPLAWARDYTAREYRWAYVFDEGMPVDALGSPVFDMAQLMGAAGADGGGAAGGSPPETGPVAVLLYGEGFGSIVLVETQTTPEIREQMKQLPEIVDSIDLGGAQAKAIVTPLGSLVMWERDGVTLVAGGMVPKADLVEFVTSVR
jgi:outer membrane lipoprotein-sorting protein